MLTPTSQASPWLNIMGPTRRIILSLEKPRSAAYIEGETIDLDDFCQSAMSSIRAFSRVYSREA